MPVNVSPTEPRPSHHLSLVAEDGTEFGFLLCDGDGNILPTAIARSNLQSQPLKTSSGESKYSDTELPFVVSAQSDFQQGIGQERFEDNQTKYQYGRRTQNTIGKLTLGPREHFTTGLYPLFVSQPPEKNGRIGRMKWYLANPAVPDRIATRFLPMAMTADRLYLMAKTRGNIANTAAHTLHFEIRANDNGDAPGTLIDSGQHLVVNDTDGMMRWLEFNEAMPAFTGADSYWLIVWPDNAADAADHVELGFGLRPSDWPAPGGTSVVSVDGGATWDAFPNADYQLLFRIADLPANPENNHGTFFEYRNMLYFITRPVDPSAAPSLYRNGWRGAADSNVGQLSKLIDATQTWASDPVGSLVWVYTGPGSEEEIAYRRITAAINGELTVEFPWRVAHTTDTEYVILGSTRWFEITHTIPFGPTGKMAIAAGIGPLASPDDDERILYIPQGHNLVARPIWMYREYNAAGTWTVQDKSINDATGGAGNYQARHIILVEDPTDGSTLVKVEDNSGLDRTNVVAEARSPGTWIAQAAWGGDEFLGDAPPASLVNTIEFEEPNSGQRVAWAFVRDKIFARGDNADNVWRSVLLEALKKFASDRTGYAAAVHNTFLYLSLAGGLLEQLTNGTLVDVGPTKGVGMPSLRTGEIASVESYPGKMFVAVDAGFDLSRIGTGYSSVLQMTGLDSHDVLYEAGRGRRIRSTFAQRIPFRAAGGASQNDHGLVNRLWIQEGFDLMWLDLPQQGVSPLNDPYYQFAPEGFVQMSRIYAHLDDKLKAFSSLKVVADSLDSDVDTGAPNGGSWIEPLVSSSGDQDTNLDPAFGGFISVGPSQEIFLTNYTPDQIVPVRGRFLSVRLMLNSVSGVEVPEIRGALVESLLGLPVKYAFSPTFLLRDDELDLNQDPQTFGTALSIADQLETWADRLEMFTLHSISPTLDGKKVVIASPEMRPKGISSESAATPEQLAKEAWIGSISIIQVIL